MYTLRAGHKKIIIYYHPGIICIKNRRYLKRTNISCATRPGAQPDYWIFLTILSPEKTCRIVSIGSIGYRAAQIWEIKTKPWVSRPVTKLTLLIITPELHSSTLAKVIALDVAERNRKTHEITEARHTTSFSLLSDFPPFSLDSRLILWQCNCTRFFKLLITASLSGNIAWYKTKPQCGILSGVNVPVRNKLSEGTTNSWNYKYSPFRWKVLQELRPFAAELLNANSHPAVNTIPVSAVELTA